VHASSYAIFLRPKKREQEMAFKFPHQPLPVATLPADLCTDMAQYAFPIRRTKHHVVVPADLQAELTAWLKEAAARWAMNHKSVPSLPQFAAHTMLTMRAATEVQVRTIATSARQVGIPRHLGTGQPARRLAQSGPWQPSKGAWSKSSSSASLTRHLGL
jgi:hypothetical protein